MSAPDLMERTRAAVCLMNSSYNGWGDNEKELYCFLSLFHPKMSFEKKMKIIRDSRKPSRH